MKSKSIQLIKEGSTIADALKSSNKEPFGICFFQNEKGKLAALFTDGDLRRLLIEKGDLNYKIVKSDFKDFQFVIKGTSLKKMIELCNSKIKILPILDDNGFLVDYFIYQNKNSSIQISQPDLLKGNELKYLLDAFNSTWISSSGKYIKQFETSFSNFVDCKYGVSTSNGTVAIQLALTALNIGEGDEVIVPNITFAATINAVLHCGAIPVLAEVEEEFWTIDPESIKNNLTKKTKAIIPVHIYGQICNMDAICQIADQHGIHIVEDCAEAHGGMYSNKKVGSYGAISTFSFFGNKIITTGEGGMCTTNSDFYYQKMLLLRDHGMSPKKKYWHDIVGFNFRMTNLQAAIGCAQLEKIDDILKRNSIIESRYKEIFKEQNIQWQSDKDPKRKRVVWIVTGMSNKRDLIIERGVNHGIDLRRFFYPLCEMDIYKRYSKGDYLISSKLSKHGFSLPTHNDVDFDKISKSLT
jgi:perosamine synthetase